MIAQIALREATSGVSCVLGNYLAAVNEHVYTLVSFSSLGTADINYEALMGVAHRAPQAVSTSSMRIRCGSLLVSPSMDLTRPSMRTFWKSRSARCGCDSKGR